MQFFKCFECCKVPSENNDVHMLDLCNCDLSDVPQTVLLYERTLETLLLNSNHIYDLPLPLFHCQSLQVLSLSNNDLATIPAAIGYLVNLKELDVSRNSITGISDSIKKCKKLSVLNASFNPLHHLPNGLTQLISLEELYLNDVALEYLPANIGRLSKLIILELRSNKISGLPKSMCRLICLARLDIGQNHFVEFPPVVGTLITLKELWCDLNEFNSIPHFIGNLKELVHFEIGDNSIQSITNNIDGCRNLVDFSACYCDIQSMPHTIGLLKHLLCLKLDYNSMTSLTDAIGGLSNLEELSLSHNKLKSLPSSIGLLRKLISLHLDSNKLKKLPPELGSCSHLSVLSLRNNQLESIPAELGNLTNLSVLVLADNKLPYLPISILKLKKLNALWLSHSQSKPLIPLQVDYNVLHNVRVLTCYLLPQQKGGEENAAERAYSDEGVNSLKKNQKIRFLLNSPQEKVGHLTRAPTPYPKKLRSLSKVAQNINQSKSSDNYEFLENCANSSRSNENSAQSNGEELHQPSSIGGDPAATLSPTLDASSYSNNSFIKTAVVKKQEFLLDSNSIPLDETDYHANSAESKIDSTNKFESQSEEPSSINGHQHKEIRRKPPPYHIAATFSKKASLFNRNAMDNQNSLRHTIGRTLNDYGTNFSDDCRDSICSEASSVPKQGMHSQSRLQHQLPEEDPNLHHRMFTGSEAFLGDANYVSNKLQLPTKTESSVPSGTNYDSQTFPKDEASFLGDSEHGNHQYQLATKIKGPSSNTNFNNGHQLSTKNEASTSSCTNHYSESPLRDEPSFSSNSKYGSNQYSSAAKNETMLSSDTNHHTHRQSFTMDEVSFADGPTNPKSFLRNASLPSIDPNYHHQSFPKNKISSFNESEDYHQSLSKNGTSPLNNTGHYQQSFTKNRKLLSLDPSYSESSSKNDSSPSVDPNYHRSFSKSQVSSFVDSHFNHPSHSRSDASSSGDAIYNHKNSVSERQKAFTPDGHVGNSSLSSRNYNFSVSNSSCDQLNSLEAGAYNHFSSLQTKNLSGFDARLNSQKTTGSSNNNCSAMSKAVDFVSSNSLSDHFQTPDSNVSNYFLSSKVQNSTSSNSFSNQFSIDNPPVFKASPYIAQSDDSDDNSLSSFKPTSEGMDSRQFKNRATHNHFLRSKLEGNINLGNLKNDSPNYISNYNRSDSPNNDPPSHVPNHSRSDGQLIFENINYFANEV